MRSLDLEHPFLLYVMINNAESADSKRTGLNRGDRPLSSFCTAIYSYSLRASRERAISSAKSNDALLASIPWRRTHADNIFLRNQVTRE